MQAQLEVRSRLERRFTISVPGEEVKKKLDHRLNQIAKTAKIKGFRPGKIPMKVIAQRYQDRAEAEVFDKLMWDNFNRAVEENELKVASRPHFEPDKGEDYLQGDFHFFATFEVLPEVVIGDLSTVEIERPMTTVSDEDVEQVIQNLRRNYADCKPVDRIAADGDRVTIGFEASIDGEPLPGGHVGDLELFLGSKTLADLETAIIGMHKDETKIIPVTLPEHYPENLVGKIAQFKTTLKTVYEVHLPLIDRDFTEKLGIQSEGAAFYEEVKGMLNREVKKRLKLLSHKNAIQTLLKVTPIELPNGLVYQEKMGLLKRIQELMEQGSITSNKARLLIQSLDSHAQSLVHVKLTVPAFIKAQGLNLETTPEQIRAIIENSAQDYDNPDEVINWYYAHPTRLESVSESALEENVTQLVYSMAQVKEKVLPLSALLRYDL